MSPSERIPAAAAYETFRDTPYKTDKALAELVDNSIQAGASLVDVVVVEKLFTQKREVARVNEIYVIDNGKGMSPDILTKSLGISNGENRNDPDGIGKFGWGLVGSTLSQCRRVDIWSWTMGNRNSYATYLDLDDKDMGQYLYQSAPQEIPPECESYATFDLSESGTIVKWSTLDRIDWAKSKTVVRNTSEILGRLYRKLLDDTRINFVIVQPDSSSEQYEVLPTDPLYLIDNRKTSNSAPYSESAMFKECEGSPEVTEEYESNGQTLDPIVLRYSHVKPDVYLQTQKSGNEPYGKHANRNKGVSLVRAGRELLLDDDWCNQTIDRWWGIEVNFKPQHDDLFGVGKDKQSARIYSDVAHQYKRFINDAMEWKSYKDGFVEGSNFYNMCTIVEEIAEKVRELTRTVKGLKQGTGIKRKGVEQQVDLTPAEKIDELSTQASEKLAVDNPIPGIHDYSKSIEEAKDELSSTLTAMGDDEESARKKSSSTLSFKRKFRTVSAEEDSEAFFNVRKSGGVVLLCLNSEHSFHKKLFSLLSEDESQTDIMASQPIEQKYEELQARFDDAYIALGCTLNSWANLELSQDEEGLKYLRKIRREWGHFAEKYLTDI